MNIDQYISSGIIESYVLGLASPEERLEFEQRCSQYPELAQAREDFEKSLEDVSQADAVAPPAGMKAQIWSRIQEADSTSAVLRELPPQNDHGNNIPVLIPRNRIKYMAAASVILLVGSTFLNIYFYRQYQGTLARYDQLYSSTQETARQNKALQTKLDLSENSFRLVNDSNMAVVAMKGRPLSPQSRSTIYWDRRSKDVYLLINNLPRPISGKQYQLWAIVDGKPVDAGLVDFSHSEALLKMKNIPKAQAFAITLEKAGGSPVPDLGAMYVMGQI